MAELTPHPLVVSVAKKLGEPEPNKLGPPNAFERAVTAVGMATTQAEQATARGAAAAVKTAVDALAKAENDLAKELANQSTVPAVCLFAGYLGGPVDHDGKDWRLLYVDPLLTDWMLILADDILVNERRANENAPQGVIDLLWVKSTANLVSGSGPRENKGRFLVGELTRAGDFAPSTRGGTFSAASGLLCEATTPGCCRPSRTTCAH